MYKLNHALLPVNYEFFCITNSEIHSYNTRSKTFYHVPKPRTVKFKFSISFSGPSLWNELPENVKCAPTLSTAKCLLKTHFMHYD